MSTQPPVRAKRRKKTGKDNTAAISRQRPWWLLGVCAAGLLGATVWAWSAREVPEPSVERGNTHYRSGRFGEALTEYESAPGAGPRNAGVHLDRGLARFRVAIPSDSGLPLLAPDASAPSGVDQAQEAFRVALRGGTTSAAEEVDAFLRARAWYDLANTLFSTRQWDHAIDAYKDALRLRPGWTDAAWNLELARRLREQDRNPPDAGPDGGQDASQPDGSPPRDGGGDGGNNDRPDGGGDGGGQGPGDGGNQGDASNDGGGASPDASSNSDGGGGEQPDASPQGESDASAPRTMAPLDQLDRSSRSLQQEMMRRRGVVPRGVDDDR
ncbi:MAG: tetratricopeptide repeat protein [Deltaproteobacteria bacterium]|nr:tetratricopeptide repeat protein [Deltaproteobacteria bacterium]